MKNIKILSILFCFLMIISVCGCSPVDKDYGVSSVVSSVVSEIEYEDVEETKIMSSDRTMSSYFDISVFDEENYSEIYLGKKFTINAIVDDVQLPVPTKLQDLAELGWTLSDGNVYDANSLVFSHETVDIYLVNKNNVKIFAQVYNSSRSSEKLNDCYIVKFKIDNAFYSNTDDYITFDINGINNSMAITDVINILGVPSHFYKVSDTSYYLDYFITKKDRRNGITIYINPVDDLITAIEYSYYK